MNGEVPTNPVEALQPGDVIRFADIRELTAFEDMVALAIEPLMNQREMERWRVRHNLRDFIKPPTFNGSITDIHLQVMESPYERLIDSRERGWKLQGSTGNLRLTAERTQSLIPHYHGFVFSADARSSRKGGESVGQIQTEMWYYPAPRQMKRNDFGGFIVRRLIAQPRQETERFIELNQCSRKIGFEVLRQAMRHPITQPMHQ